MKVAIFGVSFNQEFNRYISEIFALLDSYSVSIYIYKPFHDFIEAQVDKSFEVSGFFSNHFDLGNDHDFMISIGGDGTFLKAVTLVRDYNIPIVGINSGNLGFLSHISKENISIALEAIFDKRFTFEHRTLLKLDTETDIFGDFRCALNEITVHRKDTTSMITIQAYVDGEFLNSYWADGLIISTPTGSTAYSLSVGGPIILPESHDFVIAPIAPHNLSVRPLIIPDTSVIKLKVEGRTRNYFLSLDHRSEVLDTSTEIEINRADFSIRMIKFNNYSFYTTLRNKLMWGLDKRN